MARTIQIEPHHTEEELSDMMKNSQTKQQFLRFQTIFLAATEHFSAERIAEVCAIKTASVYKWVSLYNKHGADGLMLKDRGGRRRQNMTFAEEEALLKKLETGGEKSMVGLARSIVKHAEQKLGRKVGESYGYDVLHRHGWKKRSSHSHK